MVGKSKITHIKEKGDLVRPFDERQKAIIKKVTESLVSKAFENRYTLHPRQLEDMALNEVETFFDYLSSGDREVVVEHGRKSAIVGLGERPLLSILRIFREFAFDITKDCSPDSERLAIESLENYSEEYLYGYMTERTNQTLNDQEQLRIALSTALEKSRHELHIKNHAIHTAINGVMLTDLEGKITYLNPAFMKMWGYDNLDEALQMDCSEFLGLGDFNELIMSMNGSKGGQKDFTAVRTDGSTFDVAVSASLIQDEKSQPVGIMAFFVDITERKRLETQLQRAQKMEAIGTLAGGVAHDLNNILSGMVSYPELILLDLPEESPLTDSILAIKESGQKAAAVVQDLLTLARRGVAARDVLNLNDIISKYLTSPEFEKLKDIQPNFEIQTDFDDDLLNILGSRVHLSKTVMNLVSNAVEAMLNAGKISITTENRYIDRPIKGYDHVEEGDYVVFSVSDRGVGISPKDIERIFEPFYTKKVMGRSGTGLGMAVVWGTVKDHKGYIDIRSRVGKGTTFTLYFPVTRKELVKEKPLVSMDDIVSRGESILVIDDVEEQRRIASQIFCKLGYHVVAVSSGEEAVDYMKNHSVDLLVLDMIMDPGIDGLETYKRILKLHPGQKAIIVSGFSETKRVKEAQRLGAGAYVKKPYLLERIGLAVRAELDV